MTAMTHFLVMYEALLSSVEIPHRGKFGQVAPGRLRSGRNFTICWPKSKNVTTTNVAQLPAQPDTPDGAPVRECYAF